MSDPHVPPTMPQPPNAGDDYVKMAYEKRLEEWLEAQKHTWGRDATKLALDNARDDAVVAAESASLAAIEAAYISTTQSSLDRALTRANVLAASVGTLITLYTGLLAFLYTAADTGTGGDTGVTAAPLGIVGLVPALFLGLALLLVTVYAAVLRSKTTVGPFLPTGIGGQVAELRLVTYMRWCFAGVLARRWALHAGVTSLGFGVATLPLPFLRASPAFEAALFGVGLVAVVATGCWTQWGYKVIKEK